MRVDQEDGKQRIWQAPDGPHIDVRGLPPPEPMRSILGLIDSLDDASGVTVTVHHERDPVFLYPELHERGWQAERVTGAAGEVRLLLRRLVD